MVSWQSASKCASTGVAGLWALLVDPTVRTDPSLNCLLMFADLQMLTQTLMRCQVACFPPWFIFLYFYLLLLNWLAFQQFDIPSLTAKTVAIIKFLCSTSKIKHGLTSRRRTFWSTVFGNSGFGFNAFYQLLDVWCSLFFTYWYLLYCTGASLVSGFWDVGSSVVTWRVSRLKGAGDARQ
jgi:hypothetical protein